MGSVDANTGDLLLGWDTDQFPTDVYLTTKIMLMILKYGGFTTGGLNFDAKVRRESFEPVDLFYAHIGGMDAFAKGLKIAAAIRADGVLAGMVKRPLRLLGQRRRAPRSRPAGTTSSRSKSTCSPRATSRPTAAAGKNCSRTSSTATCFRCRVGQAQRGPTNIRKNYGNWWDRASLVPPYVSR